MSAKKMASLTCVFCSQAFADRGLLQEHFRLHGKSSSAAAEKEGGVKCEFCQMRFEQVSRAIHHAFKHHREVCRKYYCGWCGKQFPIKHTYDAHLAAHASHAAAPAKVERRCDECECDFYAAKAYEYHRRGVHEAKPYGANALAPPPSKKIYVDHNGDMQSVFYCQFCGREYVLKFNLHRHIEATHADELSALPENVVQCNRCESIFYNSTAYENHNKHHTPDDVYIANEEMRTNLVKKIDQDYDARRVRALLPSHEIKRQRNPRAHLILRKKALEAENAAKNNDMSEFSPPPSDSSDSEAEAKAEDEDADNSNADKPSDAISSLYDEGEVIEEPTNEKPSNSTSKPSTDNANDKQKCKVKYVTREELEKLKGKGLIRLTEKPKHLSSIKKVEVKTPASDKALPHEKLLIDRTPSSVKQSVDQMLASKKQSIIQTPASEKQSLNQTPASKKQSIIQTPASEKQSLNQTPASEKQSVNQMPASEKQSVNQTLASKKQSVDQMPASKKQSVDQMPASEKQSVDQMPSTEKRSIDKVSDGESLSVNKSNKRVKTFFNRKRTSEK